MKILKASRRRETSQSSNLLACRRIRFSSFEVTKVLREGEKKWKTATAFSFFNGVAVFPFFPSAPHNKLSFRWRLFGAKRRNRPESFRDGEMESRYVKNPNNQSGILFPNPCSILSIARNPFSLSYICLLFFVFPPTSNVYIESTRKSPELG